VPDRYRLPKEGEIVEVQYNADFRIMPN
jgi:hypothetical protein